MLLYNVNHPLFYPPLYPDVIASSDPEKAHCSTLIKCLLTLGLIDLSKTHLEK